MKQRPLLCVVALSAMLSVLPPLAAVLHRRHQGRYICRRCGAVLVTRGSSLTFPEVTLFRWTRLRETPVSKLLRRKGLVGEHQHRWRRIALYGPVHVERGPLAAFLGNLVDYCGQAQAEAWVPIVLRPATGRLVSLALWGRGFPRWGFRRPDAFAAWWSKAAIGRSVQQAVPILAKMRRVCDYQSAHPKRGRNNGWARSAFLAGVMAAWRATRDVAYLEQAARWAKRDRWTPPEPPVPEAEGDSHCCGQTYLELALPASEPRGIALVRRRMDRILAARPKGRELWSWSDALFMSPPTLARLAAATGDTSYIRRMDEMWWDATDHLFDPKAGLFYRDATYFNRRSKNGKKIFWSRGNGWAMAGLVRVLEYLPRHEVDSYRYVLLLRTMADSLAALQAPDGLWRSSLLDPEEYPMPETSGSAFFCYAMAWGLNNKVLAPARFLPVVRRAWQGLLSAVDPDGRLGWVQLVGREPAYVFKQNTHEYGTGAFLLAAEQMLRLACLYPDFEVPSDTCEAQASR